MTSASLRHTPRPGAAFAPSGVVRAWPLLLVFSVSACAPFMGRTAAPPTATTASLWEDPVDLEARDVYSGPWGVERAPDPTVTYTFVRPKETGTNPGVVVQDPAGHEWHVKQAATTRRGDEGPVEVVLSRVLAAVGYHQPPVYYLHSFTMRDAAGTHVEPGGRFRLTEPRLKSVGTWSWHQNPFVGSRPYQGLLAILMLFNSTDLKNSNNTLYRFTASDGRPELWYVVRDLGASLGETGRLEPRRNDLLLFERSRFVTGIHHGFVQFDFRGRHQELVDQRLSPEDVRWACALVARLTDRQWADAFRAGGYPNIVARRFVAALQARIAEGERIGGADADLRRKGLTQ